MTKEELLEWRKVLARAVAEMEGLGDYDTNAGRIRNLYVFNLHVCQLLIDNYKPKK